MSDVKRNVQKRDVWWITCHLCDYESKPTADYDEAEQLRRAHFRVHESLVTKRTLSDGYLQVWPSAGDDRGPATAGILLKVGDCAVRLYGKEPETLRRFIAEALDDAGRGCTPGAP